MILVFIKSWVAASDVVVLIMDVPEVFVVVRGEGERRWCGGGCGTDDFGEEVGGEEDGATRIWSIPIRSSGSFHTALKVIYETIHNIIIISSAGYVLYKFLLQG